MKSEQASLGWGIFHTPSETKLFFRAINWSMIFKLVRLRQYLNKEINVAIWKYFTKKV